MNNRLTEHYFEWTCPECGHIQTDGVNATQGPFLSLTCEKCTMQSDEDRLSQADAQKWEDARQAAEKD